MNDVADASGDEVRGDRAAQARALLEYSPDAALDRLQHMEHQRAALLAERRRVTQNIKNEDKTRRRVMVKARGLSTEELLDAVVSRAAQAKAKARAAAKAKPKAKAMAV